MRRILVLTILISTALFGETEFSGTGEAYSRAAMLENPRFLTNAMRFDFGISGNLSENASFALAPGISADYKNVITKAEDLYNTDYFSGVSMTLNEAYLKINKFPNAMFDVSIGREILSLGAGDIVSPLDIINPDDLSDPLKFDRKIGKEMINIDLYSDIINVEIIYLPLFKPSLLYDDFMNLETEFEGVDYIDDSIIMPVDMLESSEIFFVLSKDFSSVQASVFYGYTHTQTPAPFDITIKMASMTSAKAEVDFFFPRVHSSGFSISGTIFDLGAWIDFSANYTSMNEYSIDMSDVGRGITDTFFMEDRIFFKGLAGIDYTFFNNLYMSAQYVHGMRGEYGEEMMHDYLFLGTRFSLMNERILVEPMNVSYEISNPDLILKRGGIVFYPRVTFKMIDNLDIGAALIYVAGTDDANFYRLDDFDCAEFFMKYYF